MPEMCDTCPHLCEHFQLCATKAMPMEWWDQLVTVLNVIVLVYILRNAFISLPPPFLLYLPVAQDRSFLGCSG